MTAQAESPNRLRIELDGGFWGIHALSLAERLPISYLAGAKHVSLSLEKVDRIDEAGLAMLVRLYSHLRVRGIQLELVDVPHSVLELLSRIGFNRLVSCDEERRAEQSHLTIVLHTRVETETLCNI